MDAAAGGFDAKPRGQLLPESRIRTIAESVPTHPAPKPEPDPE
jgi:hypothetical protein